jgi:ferredoxin
MADFSTRTPQNVPGKFYVDAQCLDCDLCRETAPNNFRRFDEGMYSYVYKQPTNPEEIEACLVAVKGCCTEAIGTDGDQERT